MHILFRKPVTKNILDANEKLKEECRSTTAACDRTK